jgi:hypothetical protein
MEPVAAAPMAIPAESPCRYADSTHHVGGGLRSDGVRDALVLLVERSQRLLYDGPGPPARRANVFAAACDYPPPPRLRHVLSRPVGMPSTAQSTASNPSSPPNSPARSIVSRCSSRPRQPTRRRGRETATGCRKLARRPAARTRTRAASGTGAPLSALTTYWRRPKRTCRRGSSSRPGPLGTRRRFRSPWGRNFPGRS